MRCIDSQPAMRKTRVSMAHMVVTEELTPVEDVCVVPSGLTTVTVWVLLLFIEKREMPDKMTWMVIMMPCRTQRGTSTLLSHIFRWPIFSPSMMAKFARVKRFFKGYVDPRRDLVEAAERREGKTTLIICEAASS
jgi:hypothetical protein